MTLYNTPSQLFIPAVVTAENIKAEIFDKGIVTAEELCIGRYAEGCKKLGIRRVIAASIRAWPPRRRPDISNRHLQKAGA